MRPDPITDPAAEARLREALHAVAATTVVDRPAEPTVVELAPARPPARPRGPRLLAAAAVLVVLLLVAAAFAGRSTTGVQTGGGTGTTLGATVPATVASAGAPTTGDHWHAAYGVYDCDHFLPPLLDAGEDRLGIHTHGDGVIHIHPFAPEASGERAALGLFVIDLGGELADDGSYLSLVGTTFTAGETTCDGQPAEVRVRTWNPDRPEQGFTDHANGLRSIRLADRQAITIAIVPVGSDSIPPPPSVAELDHLADVPAS